MKKKSTASGSFKSRSNEERTTRPSTGRKPAFKRTTNDAPKRSFGKKKEVSEDSEKRKPYAREFSPAGRAKGSFTLEKPFKKPFRKDDRAEESGSNRKSSFRRDDKPSDFTKRPSGFRKRNENDSDKPFRSDKPFKSDKPFRPSKTGKPFQSDKPYKSEKPAAPGKPFKSDKPFQSDKPFKKVFRRDETQESSEGGYKRQTNRFDRPKPAGNKPVRNMGKRKTFGKDISFEEVKPDRRRKDVASESTDQKPFRKTNRTDTPNERTAERKNSMRRDEKTPYAFAGKSQTPPEYRLKNYEKTGRGRSKSKTKEKETTEEGEIRLNRYIANAGICSRREADVLIESGEIKVNGHVVTELGYKTKPSDVVKYGNRTLSREKMVYVLLNKPKDYITTTEDPEERKTVMELIKNAGQERIYPVGRLDRNTTGLLVLTNDGELAEKLSHPSNEIQKLYEVELDRPITPEDYQAIIDGVTLEDGLAKVDDLAIVSPDRKFVGIALHLGRNRIVRRIFEQLGYKVVKLDRTIYAGLTKKDLPRGHWRYLSEKEVVRLKYFV